MDISYRIPTRLQLGAVFVLAIAALGGQGSAVAAPLYAGVTDGTFYGVANLTDDVGLVSQTELTALVNPISGLAAGANGELYVAAGRTLYRYDSSLSLIGSISGSSTTLLPALSFAGDTLYAAVNDGAFHGVARLTESLALIDQVELTSVLAPISSLAVGNDDEFYVGAGRSVFRYDAAASLIGSIAGSSTTLLPAMSFVADVLYVAVNDGAFHGVAMLDVNLGLIAQIELAEVVSSITALAVGDDGEFYIGAGRTVYHYDAAANLIGSISGSSTTLIPALSFVSSAAGGGDGEPPVPVPEPPLTGILMLGLALLLLRMPRTTAARAGLRA